MYRSGTHLKNLTITLKTPNATIIVPVLLEPPHDFVALPARRVVVEVEHLLVVLLQLVAQLVEAVGLTPVREELVRAHVATAHNPLQVSIIVVNTNKPDMGARSRNLAITF